MANSILSSLLSHASFSVISTDGLVTVKNIKVVKTSFKFSSVLHKSIKEDGTTIVDAKTIQQTKFTMKIYCPTTDDLRQVNDLLQNRSKLYTITSKGLVLDFMMLDSETVKQTPEAISTIPMDLSFTELLIQNQFPAIYAQPADSSVFPLGLASLTNSATQTVNGLVSAVQQSAAKVTSAVSGLL